VQILLVLVSPDSRFLTGGTKTKNSRTYRNENDI
jgi:hypothetical protein